MDKKFKKQTTLLKSKNSGNAKPPLSLRKRILHPLLIATSIISIIMIVFFNIVFWMMLYSGVVHDLHSISGLIEQVELANNDKDININKIIKLYNEELERYAISYRSNLVFLNDESEIISSAEAFQSNEKEAIEKYVAKAKSECSKSHLTNLKIDKDILIVLSVDTNNSEGDDAYIYASVRSLWTTVKWGNRAVFVIVMLSFLAFSIASHLIANNISKPIKELSEHMEVVGDGNFSPVATSQSSEEMQTLTTSINEMLARLQAYHNAHNRSIQNLSHDLKTPLMSIGGYAEGIKYGVLNDTQEAADVIINESKRLTSVVEKVLILSDLDALHKPIKMDFLNINSFLNDEVKSLDGYALKENIKVECKFESKSENVLADTELLSTIVRNLLSNAIRYAKNIVSVKTFEEDDIVYLCVCDDGIGLSDEDKKYLFTRYYVGKTGHTGLGLAAAKSAAEYMGCAIKGLNRNELDKNNDCYNENGAIFIVKFFRTKK